MANCESKLLRQCRELHASLGQFIDWAERGAPEDEADSLTLFKKKPIADDCLECLRND